MPLLRWMPFTKIEGGYILYRFVCANVPVCLFAYCLVYIYLMFLSIAFRVEEPWISPNQVKLAPIAEEIGMNSFINV